MRMPPLRCVAVAATSLTLAACHSAPDHAVELPAVVETTAPTITPTPVEEVVADATFEVTGSVEPGRSVVVGAPTLARVDQVHVAEGDVVADGDAVARLDTTTAQLQVAQARANVASARVQLDRVNGDIERFSPLVDHGVVSQQQLDQLVAQRDGLLESVQAAEATVSLARTQVADGVVRAPFDGVVTLLHAEPGAMASPGSPLVRIVDMSVVDVRLRLPERAMREVRVGDALDVRVPALDVERAGTVRYIDPELDPTARTGEVVVRVGNADGAILAGTFAEVTLARRAPDHALVVPTNALLRTADGDVVFRQQGTSWDPVNVVATPFGSDRWRVTGAIAAGDVVATGSIATLGQPGEAPNEAPNEAPETTEDTHGSL